MSVWQVLVCTAFLVLAVAHSCLGEKLLIAPLLKEDWKTRLPRHVSRQLLRFAWHLTSVAWVGLAMVCTPLSVELALGFVGGVSALVVLSQLRGHFAWPVFLMILFGAGMESGFLVPMLRPIAWTGVAIFSALSLLHIYWGFGGTKAGVSVTPTDQAGGALFQPSKLACFGVAGALIGMAAALSMKLMGGPGWAVYIVIAGLIALTLRIVGDGKYIGFSKRFRGSEFGQKDDALYTPLVVWMAFATAATLVCPSL